MIWLAFLKEARASLRCTLHSAGSTFSASSWPPASKQSLHLSSLVLCRTSTCEWTLAGLLKLYLFCFTSFSMWLLFSLSISFAKCSQMILHDHFSSAFLALTFFWRKVRILLLSICLKSHFLCQRHLTLGVWGSWSMIESVKLSNFQYVIGT